MRVSTTKCCNTKTPSPISYGYSVTVRFDKDLNPTVVVQNLLSPDRLLITNWVHSKIEEIRRDFKS